jgi:hypothetical protein
VSSRPSCLKKIERREEREEGRGKREEGRGGERRRGEGRGGEERKKKVSSNQVSKNFQNKVEENK